MRSLLIVPPRVAVPIQLVDSLPTHLKVMADYDCFPLWDAGPTGPSNLDPTQLPISEGLAARLDLWAEKYDRTLRRDDPPASGFASFGERSGFVEEGRRLAGQLVKELGPVCTVLYFNDLIGEVEIIFSAESTSPQVPNQLPGS